MGQEAVCVARYMGEVARGKALLESEELRFRGGMRLIIPFAEIESVSSVSGELHLAYRGSVVTLELGDLAERWAEKISNPRRLIDKLDVKPQHRVALLGVSDSTFVTQLWERTGSRGLSALEPNLDLVFLQADTKPALARIPEIEPYLTRDGGIWVVAPKGRKTITELDVLYAGRAADLLDVKVARFSETHTAHKFVIPKSRR